MRRAMKAELPKSDNNLCVAFIEQKIFGNGTKQQIALDIHAHLQLADSRDIQVFDLESGEPLVLDTSGSESDIRARYPMETTEISKAATKPSPTVPPRPTAVSKTVKLLPRHWQWLESQPSGASAALRRLVDEARKAAEPQDRARLSQNRTHSFLSSMAGDLAGFEDATRALYAADKLTFETLMDKLPTDIARVAKEFGQDAFNSYK